MQLRRLCWLIFSACTVPTGWCQSAESSGWTDVRTKAITLLSDVPNYTCVETLAREERSGFREATESDRLRVEVAFVNDKEIYSWPGQKNFSNEKLSQLIGDGLTSTGLFASVPRNIFLHEAYRVRFAKEEKHQGKRAWRYDFQSGPGQKYWKMGSGNRTGAAGEQGSFWVDPITFALLTIAVDATELPPDLPYKEVHVVIEYSPALLTGRHVLLPETATVDAVELRGALQHLRLEFSHCRSFGAESQITQSHEGETTASRGTSLPAGLTIRVRLDQPLDTTRTDAGMPVQASTLESVRLKNQAPIPAGSVLHGIVRRVWKAGNDHLVTLEFDTLDTPLGPALFYGRLVSMDEVVGLQPYLSKKNRKHNQLGGELADELQASEIPGLAMLLIGGNEVIIPKDTQMIWKIERLEQRTQHGDAPNQSFTQQPHPTNLPNITIHD